ncbi:MAG TPA: hypothetical protein VHR18_12165 [Solirubrobacterales bacterium]|jgi:hypothetical protein|nr:hypothetical protein [Solirubrobacterales bacterium]
MLRKLTTRISPASCLAMVALFVALGGGAYAAAGKIGTPDIKNGAVTKVKIKKEAVTNAKIKNDAVTGAKVNEATLGIVPDAAKLAGKAPSGFESKGFGGTGDTVLVNVPKDSVKTVATQSLSAGTYLVLARGGVNNNSGSEIPASGIHCELTAGAITQRIDFGALAKNGEPGDREEFDVFVVATLPGDGAATLSCDANSSWSGNVTDPTIAAVSLQP